MKKLLTLSTPSLSNVHYTNENLFFYRYTVTVGGTTMAIKKLSEMGYLKTTKQVGHDLKKKSDEVKHDIKKKSDEVKHDFKKKSDEVKDDFKKKRDKVRQGISTTYRKAKKNVKRVSSTKRKFGSKKDKR